MLSPNRDFSKALCTRLRASSVSPLCIYIDGKKTGLAINHGDGGVTLFEFISKEAREAFEAAAQKWAVGSGKEDAHEPGALFLESMLQALEDQKRKEINAKRGMPITVHCYAGAKYGEGLWEKDFYLGASDEETLKKALAENKVVEWRRI